MHTRRVRRSVMVAAAVLIGAAVTAVGTPTSSDEHAPGAAPPGHWTADRMAAAQPRDLVLDQRGLGYLRGRGGALTPHGHEVAADPSALAKPATPGKPPGGGSDTTPPEISAVNPAPGATIGASHVFSAVVVDSGSGVRTVTFVITYPSGTQTQSFAASQDGDTWSVAVDGLTDGAWSWHVAARDGAKRGGGNAATSPSTPFTVDTGGGGGGGGGSEEVGNAVWTSGGDVQTAAGRIYFEMPTNTRHNKWAGYVCSGTAATDDVTGRSVILTAAHCVYDDVHKAFARNVLFIPDQDGTTGAGTDTDCTNDPLGCWSPSFGVVDSDWATRTFPDNIPWDYGYYVVADTGAHQGAGPDAPLDVAAGTLAIQLSDPAVGGLTHALGYSVSDDPRFMYCTGPMGTEDESWWLPSCLLSGGASGGPWVQPMDEATGSGPIISVNSWTYPNQPGMAGPKLAGSSASCVFAAAKSTPFAGVTDRGAVPAAC